MSVSWKEFLYGFRVGSDTGNIEPLSALITADVEWVTSEMHRAATLSWTSTASFRVNGDAETFYENDAMIAGTHAVLDNQGRQNLVKGIAQLRDGKIYRYDHMRRLSGT